MARIDLNLAHAYKPDPQNDDDYALLPLRMSFADGGAYALLGPSGCGKTTMLNIVSGLVTPSHGRVTFDGRDVTDKTPQERNIVYLAIIYENECTYCMAGHTNLSRMAKVEPEAISAVREGRPIADAKLEALRQFAAKVTRQRGVVSQAEVAAFKAAGYDNQAVLDVLVLAATKLISNYTNHLAETPNDSFMKGAEWNPPGKLKPAA